jgi:tRNA(Ile)-lysidine synthase
MVLLDVLDQLRRQHGWRLAVAHFNHRLRGRASDLDERWVRREAARRGLPFVNERADVAGYARRAGLSVEMAARQLRHEFLARAARQLKLRAVALAHHADDQVELFFLRLLRGAGGEGLAGMKFRSQSPADRRVALVRPLLEQPKSALRAYAKEQGLHFREDASNAALEMKRNRVRHRLLPLLARQYQPAVGDVIRRTMKLLEGEADFVRQAAEGWLKAQRHEPFTRLHPAVQRQVIQMQLIRLGIGPTFELVERLRTRAGGTVSTGPDGLVRRDREGLIERVAMLEPVFHSEERIVELASPVRRAAFGGLQIRWSLIRASCKRGHPRFGSGCEYFDADNVGSSITLRHWQPGDRFQPIGMRSAVKLQDLFTNARIPRAERHHRVMGVTANGVIFWVEGLRIGERFKLDKGTVTRLKWRWRRGASRVAYPRRAC